ncbi:hypothetical protein BH09PLA1_BH09PLA1_25180 [soil metagenome]
MKDVTENPKRKPVTLAEVREAFEPVSEKYPPVLGLDAAAEISGYMPSTLKKKLSEGMFADCVSRGKPLRFWRDRFVMAVMNRPWSSPARHIRECESFASSENSEGGDHEIA